MQSGALHFSQSNPIRRTMSELEVLDAHDFATEAAQIEVPMQSTVCESDEFATIADMQPLAFSSCHDDADEVEKETRITIEIPKPLDRKGNESPQVRAFKHCLSELLTRRQRSLVPVSRYDGKGRARRCTSLPSVADFAADLMLAGSRTLSPAMYRIYCWAVETDFEFWDTVPDIVRKHIMHTVGKRLLANRIFVAGKTAAYWSNGLYQRAPKAA